MAFGMHQLRKAGQYVKDLDRKYADAIYARRGDGMSQMGIDTQVTPIGDIRGNVGNIGLADAVDYNVRGGMIGVPEYMQGLPQGMQEAAYIASNAGVRYGLPAAGITLAGKGLYDLTAAFGNGGDYPSEGTLPL